MARPREFDEAEVLDRAMEVFCSRGYKAASIQDLCDAMGIGRASAYAAFGSKHDLFVHALEHYEQFSRERVLSPLAASGSPLAILHSVFMNTADARSGTAGFPCLMVKSALDTAHADPLISAAVQRMTSALDNAFHKLLVRATNEGELDARRDLRALARYLTHTLHALSVSGAVRGDRRTVRSIVRTALSVLD